MHKRIYKIHIRTLFAIAHSKELMELYCCYLNMHSIYNYKTIHNYKSRSEFLRQKTGLSDHQLRRFTNLLLKHGFAHIDRNKRNFNLSAKIYSQKYFNVDTYGKMQSHASKFITIEKEENITNEFLYTLLIQLKQNQKRLAYGKNLLKSKGIEVNRSKMTLEYLKIIEPNEVKKMANLDANIFLYLKEITKLFAYKDNSGASKFLKNLQKTGLIKVEEQKKPLRKINGTWIDTKYSKKTSIHDGILFEQSPNRLSFNTGYQSNNMIIKWLESCEEKSLPARKHNIDVLRKRKKQEVTREKIKELYVNAQGKECGYFSYEKVKYTCKDTGKRKICRKNKRLVVLSSLIGSTTMYYKMVGDGHQLLLKKEATKKSTISGHSFMVDKKWITDYTYEIGLYEDLDILDPIMNKYDKGTKRCIQLLNSVPDHKLD